MLIGRTEEIAKLAKLVDGARQGMSGAIVLRGEAGIGKSALLDATARSAQDLSVIRLEGIEFEMRLGWAALHRLLLPFLERFEQLPAPQREALNSAFGLTSSAPADRFLVSLSALTLLGDVAADRALLILVDDAQWLDRESLDALVFVARRLYADPVALVFAARESPETEAAFQGIPELRVGGLDDISARDLLVSSLSDPVSYRVAQRFIAVTQGNPLALLELSGELTTEHLADQAPLPDPLPVGELVEARFLRQVRLLPADTQAILLIAAADPEGETDTLRKAAESLGISAHALEPAVNERLLAIRSKVEFRHPLVRSAVYSGGTTNDRRRAHLALAEAIDAASNPDQRALHMALAAVGPDEELAASLEQSAVEARTRGGYIAESSFLVRAASLSADPHRRARRLLAAARAAFLAGNAGYSESLLHQARPHLADPIERAQAQRLDGDLQYSLGKPHLGPSLLIEAAKAFEPLDRVLCHYALLEAFVNFGSSLHCTEGTTAVDIGQFALNSLRAQSTSLSAADLLLKGVALRWCADYADAVPAMRDAVRAQSTLSVEDANAYILGFAMAEDLWDEMALRDVVNHNEAAARTRGSLSALVVALLALVQIDLRTGHFAAARGRYSEIHEIMMTMGSFVELYDLFDVQLLGWQGDERTLATAAQLREAGGAFHTHILVHMADYALSVYALGNGHYETALTAAKAVADADVSGWSGLCLPTVVEAGTRCGDHESASMALTVLTERATVSGTPWALGLLARCRALTTLDSSAGQLYREALDFLGQTSWATEVAHTHLLFGEWLRRQKRRGAAQEQLRRAYELFDSMGAKAFAERARIELLAAGVRAESRHVESAHALTPREMQIARLAARRATSREIAAQLFISANTVDYHLRKVFQKFGISSRRELAGMMGEVVDQFASRSSAS
jgi:DNA-binding CsgD family transcriptional regulator